MNEVDRIRGGVNALVVLEFMIGMEG